MQSHAENGDKNVRKKEEVQTHIHFIRIVNYSTTYLLQAEDIVSRLQEYIAKHPDLIIIDPLDNIRNLSNRCKSYEFIQEGIRFKSTYL